jgi:hypothetical protein
MVPLLRATVLAQVSLAFSFCQACHLFSPLKYLSLALALSPSFYFPFLLLSPFPNSFVCTCVMCHSLGSICSASDALCCPPPPSHTHFTEEHVGPQSGGTAGEWGNTRVQVAVSACSCHLLLLWSRTFTVRHARPRGTCYSADFWLPPGVWR